MDIKEYMQTVGRQARAASRRLPAPTHRQEQPPCSPLLPPSVATPPPWSPPISEDLAAAPAPPASSRPCSTA
jgi:hypothetical protein